MAKFDPFSHLPLRPSENPRQIDIIILFTIGELFDLIHEQSGLEPKCINIRAELEGWKICCDTEL